MRFYYLIVLIVALHLIGCNNDTGSVTDTKNNNNPSLAIDAGKTPSSASTAANAGTDSALAVSAAGEHVAEKCIQCHTIGSASAPDTAIPYITGQYANYLTTSIQAYIHGARVSDEKKTLFASLTDTQTAEVVAYYSNLPRQWRSNAAPSSLNTKKKLRIPINSTIELASSCFACHGPNGNSQTDSVPSIAGLSADYLQSALSEYISGRRDNEFMKVFKHSLDHEKITQLSEYFSTQKRRKTTLSHNGNVNTGEKLASKLCAGCHGIKGNSAVSSIPSLSGQNAAYLIKAIGTYSDGTRKNAMMKQALNNVSTKNIRHIAGYYATQTPDPAVINANDTTVFDPVNDGKALAAACTGCHGENGNSKHPGIPSLSGLDTDYLSSAINAYKKGDRDHALMQFFVTPLTPDDISKVALFYALQEPKAAASTDSGNITAISGILSTCAACHGDKGNSQSPPTPSLAGQDGDYLIQAIVNYQSGQRKHEDMRNATADLTPADINSLAQYYAAQSAVKPKTRIPETPEVIAQRCNRCHGAQGLGDETNLTVRVATRVTPNSGADVAAIITAPILAGQSEQYLFQSLQDYQSGVRKNSAMRAMADVLSVLEMKAIARYYSTIHIKSTQQTP